MTRGGETAIDNGEEVLAYVPDETPADVAAEDNIDPSEPAPAAARTAPGHATRRIAVGLIASWAVLVATPGALPWTAEDNAARAIAIAVVVATVVALIGLALAFLADDSLAEDGASFGTAAAAIAMALVALQVVNVLLIPDDAAYRSAVVAIGLLILLAVALVSATGARISSFEGFKFSSLTLIGTLIGVVLVAVYLFAIQFVFGSTGPETGDPQWIRMTSLLTGLQTLAFAAAGALLGTAIQSQVTSSVRNDLGNADNALDELRGTLEEHAEEGGGRAADGGHPARRGDRARRGGAPRGACRVRAPADPPALPPERGRARGHRSRRDRSGAARLARPGRPDPAQLTGFSRM